MLHGSKPPASTVNQQSQGSSGGMASHWRHRAAISDATYRALPGAEVTSLGTVRVKTRAEPLQIWRLDSL